MHSEWQISICRQIGRGKKEGFFLFCWVFFKENNSQLLCVCHQFQFYSRNQDEAHGQDLVGHPALLLPVLYVMSGEDPPDLSKQVYGRPYVERAPETLACSLHRIQLMLGQVTWKVLVSSMESSGK